MKREWKIKRNKWHLQYEYCKYLTWCEREKYTQMLINASLQWIWLLSTQFLWMWTANHYIINSKHDKKSVFKFRISIPSISERTFLIKKVASEYNTKLKIGLKSSCKHYMYPEEWTDALTCQPSECRPWHRRISGAPLPTDPPHFCPAPPSDLWRITTFWRDQKR